MKTNDTTLLLAATLILSLSIPSHSQHIHGTLKPWHKVTIDFQGPSTSERATPNPFIGFRLDVTFEGPGGQTYKVPGFYAADGKAAETSAKAGNVWRVNYCPDQAGQWQYQASFVQGSGVAADLAGGQSAGFFDGQRGRFTVSPNNKTDPRDFRSRGKLVYVGEHFLQFQGSKDYFLKVGANGPEIMLEYAGFDNTPSPFEYAPHVGHWRPGDPTWQGGKGKGIIGVINYLAGLGVNVHYFLTMNAYGDGKDAWPWLSKDETTRYDCSKLAQWDIVFQLSALPQGGRHHRCEFATGAV